SERNVTLGQQNDAFDIRFRTTQTSTNGLPSLTSPSAVSTTDLQHVVFTRTTTGATTVYIDGQPVGESNLGGDLSNWNSEYQLIVGNEATGDRPWTGELSLIAVFARSLTADEVRRNFSVGPNDDGPLPAMLPPAADRPIDFVADVQPIFRERCFECHSAGNEEGGLNLSLRARALEGGRHGALIEPQQSARSLLIHAVAGVDEELKMPPEGQPLSREQIATLRAWIDQGAAWPLSADVPDPRLERAKEHWAFQPLQQTAFSAEDVDTLVDERLQKSGLSRNIPADAVTLVRRIYFGLIGLPPNPDQVADFVQAAAVDRDKAVQELTDRLLADRGYGERWGRHWLDVARYADSDGQEADRDRPDAWHYRDFVIKAFNDDLPFNTFVQWQVAGDEIEPSNADAVAATGFLAAGPRTVLEDSFLEEERLRNRYNELDDIVSTLGTGMLGLTLGCARCHDHKYDALSSREYYRLLSAFHSGDRVTDKLPNGQNGFFFRDQSREARTTWLFGRGDFYDREREVRLGFPAILTSDTSAEKYWQRAREQSTDVPSTMQRRALADWLTDVNQGAGSLVARVIVNRIWQHHFGHGLVRTVSDFGVRGETPTHPELLEWLTVRFVSEGWKLKPLHRLILNSKTYQQSSVLTDGNVQSATNQHSAKEIDPENRLLWKQTPRRLEAEILRDAMLAVSGTLNPKPYGPGFKPPIPAEAILARNLKDGGYPSNIKDSRETRRRSVYMFHKRVVPYPLFQAFDRPDLLQSCGRREATTVAPQALALMNDHFVRRCAEDTAARLLKDCGPESPTSQFVERMFLLSFGRRPTDRELLLATSFVDTQRNAQTDQSTDTVLRRTLTDFCQSIFGLNEFIYVD
ncbi:MAG: DUF1553 domain-containing protein, partial [Planctomycetaceae bacterium]|nr:DUF1553 domain-containing protein [Planctomycetaceae bacterium]